MNHMNFPSGWSAGASIEGEQLYSDPPESPDKSRIQFFGLREGDTSHRLYSMPVDTPVADVVRAFEVGSHNCVGDVPARIALVADKATRIAKLVPCRVIFADQAGLKLKFTRQITVDEVKMIEAMFSVDEMIEAGLDRYLSELGCDEGLATVLAENTFHFWWD